MRLHISREDIIWGIAVLALAAIMILVMNGFLNEEEARQTVVPDPTPVSHTLDTGVAVSSADHFPKLQPTQTPLPRRVNAAGRLVIGGDPYEIPAIFDTEPLLVDVETGNEEWLPDMLVIGLDINGEQTAYPISFLSFHEVINDDLGGQPVVVTWCPLCFSAVVYDRTVEDEVRRFRASGYLFESNLVLEDMETRTLWSQISGLVLRGPHRYQLTALPFQLMTWGEWQTQHPNTTIISGQRSPHVDRFDYSYDPYGGYYGGVGGAGIGRTTDADDRIDPRSIVIGIDINRESIAVPYNDAFEDKIIHFTLGGTPLVIFMDTDTASPVVYTSTLNDQVLSFVQDEDSNFIDTATESIWNVRTGIAESGDYEGQRLQALAFRSGFWFGWADNFPDTTIWGIDFE